MNINYLTEDPISQYKKGVDEAKDANELIKHIAKYRKIANDAFQAALAPGADFEEFETGLKKERKKKYAGDKWAEKYGAIIMPVIMFQTSVVADQFVVPWGLAYIRLKEMGAIVEKRGIAEWVGIPDE